jgi:allantoate deiminase
MSDRVSMAALDAMTRDEFVAALGGVFEHSSWVAAAAWARRPFADLDALHRAMIAAVESATHEAQLTLIASHPELGAARIATNFSKAEQAAAALAAAGRAEQETLRDLNRAYRDRFGFPFVMAVKGRTREEIVAAIKERLDRAPEAEFAAALAEIAKIARFRLEAIFGEADPLQGAGARLLGRADELGAITEEPGKVTRTFLTPQHRAAAELVMRWMRQAGMVARIDNIGNVVGRYEASSPGAPALLLGSHLDTVRDAGKYDGILGVLTAIECVGALHARGERLPFGIEVLGFGDEEGVRFQSTLLGSRAVAGTFDKATLDRRDAEGISLTEALRRFELDPTGVGAVARRRADVLGYIELHIEQGPVLEAEGLPVGIVTSIAGVTRAEFTVTGVAGHAGTVPMVLRHDALAAAAEMILAIEARAGTESSRVATVGRIASGPGAVNVIPGRAQFSLDLRSPEDAIRRAAYDEIVASATAIAARRGVALDVDRTFEEPAVACSAAMMAAIEQAIVAVGVSPRRLASGAGHDAMAMATLAPIGMIFVRCKGGISHNPAESITPEDAEIGARVLDGVVRGFHEPPVVPFANR